MDDLEKMEEWLTPLIRKLSPAGRKRLAKEIGVSLRRSQSERIKQQKNPDDSPFAPRKKSPQNGRSERMFEKIRRAKYLKMRSSSQLVSIGFDAKVSRIARVHQYGLKDKVSKYRSVYLEQRELLGLSEEDTEIIENTALEFWEDNN